MTRKFKDYSEILRHHALNRKDSAALYHGNDCISYSLLEKNVNRFGNVLKALGLKPGDGVLLVFPDCPDFFYAFLGAMKYGVRPILLNPDMPQGFYEYALRDSLPSALITTTSSHAFKVGIASTIPVICIGDRNYARLWEKASADLTAFPIAGDGVDFLLYSSGSTGEPKGIPHSQGDMLFCAERYSGDVLEMRETDVVFSASRLHFAYGLGNSLVFPLYFGASVILNPHSSGPADVFHVFSLIMERHPTVFFGVPSLYNMMLKSMVEPFSFPSLRLCVSAGEPLPAGVFNEWKRLTGLEILDGIGSTEALHIYISNRPGAALPGRTGVVVPGYESRIIGEDGATLSSGQPGTLHIRGESVADFYWNRPDLTSKAMLDDGWFDTGDVFVEENGCLTYRGRTDDMFKSGGAWVSPVLVEQVLLDHPMVLECVVASCRMEGLLKPVAHVVLKPEWENERALSLEMRSLVLDRLPSHMCPVRFVFTDRIPRTGTGKIQRRALVP
jgi:benzoate-CoA ligase family protein